MATIYGTLNNDLLKGTLLAEDIFTKDGNDVVHAGGGDDRVYAGSGDDQVWGDDGNDSLFGQDGNDTVYGGNGNDLVSGGAGNDTLYGDDGKDILSGGDGNDVLSGGAGNDGLAGGSGNDIIDGGSGDDFIVGGAGKDLMTGGTGANSFWWYAPGEGSVGDAGRDVITDFKPGTDTIHLLSFRIAMSDIHFSALNGGASTLAWIDFDHNGTHDFEIQFNNVSFGTLHTTDFAFS